MCILEEPWSFDLVNGGRDLLTSVPFFLRLQSADSQRSPIRCKRFKLGQDQVLAKRWEASTDVTAWL